MLITSKGDQSVDHYLAFIEQCIKEGVTSVQLREKHLSYNEILEFGKKLKAILKSFEIPLIVNDSLELVLALDADGLHLGQSDGNVWHARKVLGESKIIGLTIDNLEQLQDANARLLDYIGIGAIYPTKSKANVNTIWGIEALKKAVAMFKHTVIAIGGINESNAAEVIKAGAHGIAAIAAFHDAKDPKQTTQNLIKIINSKYSKYDQRY